MSVRSGCNTTIVTNSLKSIFRWRKITRNRSFLDAYFNLIQWIKYCKQRCLICSADPRKKKRGTPPPPSAATQTAQNHIVYVVRLPLKIVDRYNHKVFAKRMFPKIKQQQEKESAQKSTIEWQSSRGKKMPFAMYVFVHGAQFENILVPLSRLASKLTVLLIPRAVCMCASTHARRSFFYFLFTFSPLNSRTSCNKRKTTKTMKK